MKNNIEMLIKNDLCYQCGTCESACPTNCISMNDISNKGLIYPKVNNDKCISCGKCLKICPINNISLENQIESIKNSKDIGIFYPKYKNNIENTSSGGVVSNTLRYLFEEKIINKAIVAGWSKDNSKPEPRIINRIEEIDEISGSIYQPVALNKVLKEIKKGDKVAFVGLPCHVNGITNLETINPLLREALVIKIGLICTIGRGKNGTDLVLNKFRKDNKIINYRYRQGSYPGNMSIKTNKEVLNIPYGDYLKYIDFLFMPKGCLFCNDLFNINSDFTVGDPWGLVNEKSAMVIVNTDNGLDILNKTIHKGYYYRGKDLEYEEAIKTQSHCVNYKIYNYNDRINIYKKLGMKIPRNLEKLESHEKSIKIKIGYILLAVNSKIFNTKFMKCIFPYIPEKLIFTYRAKVSGLNCKRRKNYGI